MVLRTRPIPLLKELHFIIVSVTSLLSLLLDALDIFPCFSCFEIFWGLLQYNRIYHYSGQMCSVFVCVCNILFVCVSIGNLKKYNNLYAFITIEKEWKNRHFLIYIN